MPHGGRSVVGLSQSPLQGHLSLKISVQPITYLL